MYKLGENVASKKTQTQPMTETNVGANLVFARRTKTGIKPMFENEFETIASDIGSQTIVVRRANIRFAPTLVSDFGWISITTIYPKTYVPKKGTSMILCFYRQKNCNLQRKA